VFRQQVSQAFQPVPTQQAYASVDQALGIFERGSRMDTFRVESVRINAPLAKAFEYIANVTNLPKWTNAFKSASDGKAVMATPAGTVEASLQAQASKSEGTIDWHITFPDGSVASAYSRLVPVDAAHSVYSFVLMAPPVALEQLEGTLDQQAAILKEELAKLSSILSNA
jgi:hypothetical protein